MTESINSTTFISRPYLVYGRSRLSDRLASVCRLSVALCIVAKRCVHRPRAKVTTDSL